MKKRIAKKIVVRHRRNLASLIMGRTTIRDVRAAYRKLGLSVPEALTPDPEVETVPEPPAEVFTEMTVPELKAACKAARIRGYSKLNREALIKKLQE